jgi:hypothetical protein
MLPYVEPSCRVRELDLENNLLTGSNEAYPIDPYDPEFDD